MPSHFGQRVRAFLAFCNQGGLCYWCKLPIKVPVNENNPLFLTIDHLEQKRTIGSFGTVRDYVAAHRVCNNTRNHGQPKGTAKQVVLSTLGKL